MQVFYQTWEKSKGVKYQTAWFCVILYKKWLLNEITPVRTDFFSYDFRT